ncbi:MAG: acetyl-CoA carboxylase biotin carboxyl carrier protein subunit [Bacteroidales bacterium]|nr:acetyl-CoA carboxylase biotin carboxyl carrier protein subunit [Bacteroidales bacterium]
MKEFENLGMLNINSIVYKTRLSAKFMNKKPYKKADQRMILSFIPGTVLDIMVREGQKVSKGEDLMILDAMKMQNKLKSTIDGTIKKIFVSKGNRVAKGTKLIEMK